MNTRFVVIVILDHELKGAGTQKTSVESYLSIGRIAVLSPFEAANAFVRRVRWAGTFARDGRGTMRSALVRGYVAVGRHMSPQKCPFPVGDLYPM